tara:strand:- start:360 stop:617 length:258 start_codon:yes stop_codon:yes gene_type:complete
MYIVLSLTPDRNGYQGQVALNTERINGFKENCYHDMGGNVEKDLAGYPQTYTEVLMKGATLSVAETIPAILEKIREIKTNQIPIL